MGNTSNRSIERMTELGNSLNSLSLEDKNVPLSETGRRFFSSGMRSRLEKRQRFGNSSAAMSIEKIPQHAADYVFKQGNVEPGISVKFGTVPGEQPPRKPRGDWTFEQDEALKIAVEKHGGKNWKAIAADVPGDHTHIQCLQRWGKVLKPGLIKGPWTEEEDALLRQFVPLEARNNWVAVAEHVPGRTAKQCRERWSLCLDPNIRKEPWTDEEDQKLLDLHEEHGNAWALIAKHLPGRTVNSVKSRFKSIERKQNRAWTTAEDAAILRGKADEKKWSVIASTLPNANRSKHAVKTRWKELVERDPNLAQFDSSQQLFTNSSPSSVSMPQNSHYVTTASLHDPFLPPFGFNFDARDENGTAAPPRSIEATLSSDKLMNVRVQRNDSFEDWLQKEAGHLPINQNSTSFGKNDDFLEGRFATSIDSIFNADFDIV